MIFSKKLDDLYMTFEAISGNNFKSIQMALTIGMKKPAVAVGSGGSLATAYYWQRCRDTLGAHTSLVQTPLSFSLSYSDLTETQVWIFSAQGENPDVLSTLETAVARGAKSIHVVVSNRESTLARLAHHQLKCTVHHIPVIDPKDGFLATHSFAAAMLALLRASDCIGIPKSCDVRYKTFLQSTRQLLSSENRKSSIKPEWKISKNDTLILLHDPRIEAAAKVLETSLWETAICPVQLTDFRNFAHGRHVWLAHRATNTIVISLTGSETRKVWGDIESVLPKQIRRLTLDYSNAGRFQTALACVEALRLVEFLGAASNIDPAKPGVAAYGRNIYAAKSLKSLSGRLNPSLRQKMATVYPCDNEELDLDTLEAYQKVFFDRLYAASYKGLILDYDGTIVTTADRWFPPEEKIVHQFIRLLEGGIKLGIATGRGKSAGSDLRSVIPEEYHNEILVGYYNGGYIRPLSVDIAKCPPPPHLEIQAAYNFLIESKLLTVKPDSGHYQQITIDQSSIKDAASFNEAFTAYNVSNGNNLNIVASGHSLDICLASVCKTNVLQELSKHTQASEPPFLCIGDSGHIGGNDYKLLGGSFGVSVSNVCSRVDKCWSFYGDSVTGPPALTQILEALEITSLGTSSLSRDKLKYDKWM